MGNLVATVLGDRHSVDGLGPSTNVPGRLAWRTPRS